MRSNHLARDTDVELDDEDTALDKDPRQRNHKRRDDEDTVILRLPIVLPPEDDAVPATAH